MYKSIRLIIVSSLALLSLGFVSIVNAAMVISASNSTLNFASKASKTQYLTITNNGDNKAYVTLDVSRLEAVNGKYTKQVREKNPKRLGLLVTPTKLILKPGQKRKIRVVNMVKSNKQDVFFKVQGSQITPPSREKKQAPKGGVGIKAEIGIGSNTLVVVRPAVMNADINVVKKGSRVVFTNQGNTMVKLKNMRQCDASSSCEALGNLTLMPGATRSRNLANADAQVKYTVSYPGKTIEKTLD